MQVQRLHFYNRILSKKGQRWVQDSVAPVRPEYSLNFLLDTVARERHGPGMYPKLVLNYTFEVGFSVRNSMYQTQS